MKRKLLVYFITLSLVFIMAILGINFYVVNKTSSRIISLDDASKLENIDAVLVLGCRANADGPSLMLKRRLDKSLEVYEKLDTKLLVSGDHGHFEYDEVNTMRNYILNKNINSKDIFMDHAGFSTYDSIYRAKEIFGCSNIIIVTQEYHLYRALYIAESLSINAYGVKADEVTSGQLKRDIREILARDKDYFKVKFKPKSTYVGEKISIKGDGNVTVDWYFLYINFK